MADKVDVIPEKEEDEQPIVPYGYSQNLIRKKKRCARTLRTILVVANIIFWLGGCGMLGVSIWLRFMNPTVKKIANFETLNIILLVVLAVGVMFLVIALVGTCGANMKNKILLVCYIVGTSVAALTEIVVIFVYATSKESFAADFVRWYRGIFALFTTDSRDTKRHLVEYLQVEFQCCGLENGVEDFYEQNFPVPASCIIKSKNATTGRIESDFRETSCISVLTQEFNKYIDIPFYVLPAFACLQLIGIITGLVLLYYLIKNQELAQEDSDIDSDLDDENDAPMELPKPKLYRILKQSKDKFGISLDFDEERRGHIVRHVDEAEGIRDIYQV